MTDREKKAADEWSLARIVGVVAQHIPGDKNEKFLVLIRRFTDEGARVRALTAISQAFSDPQSEEIREEAFNLAQSIENPWLRCRALTGLAYRLPQYKVQALHEAITAVEGIPSEYHRARALGGMAGLLPEELVDKALELIRSIQDDALRFYYLAFFAPHLTEEEQMRVLKAITSSPGDVMHIQALLALSKVLPSPAMKEVLTYVHGLTQPEAKAYALASLASKYPEEEALMEDALSAALQILNPYDRTELLGQLASQLPESDRSEVINTEISAVRQSGDVLLKVYGLQALVPCLAEEKRNAVIHEILQSARTIEDAGLRAEVLVSLYKELPDADQTQLVSEVVQTLELLMA